MTKLEAIAILVEAALDLTDFKDRESENWQPAFLDQLEAIAELIDPPRRAPDWGDEPQQGATI